MTKNARVPAGRDGPQRPPELVGQRGRSIVSSVSTGHAILRGEAAPRSSKRLWLRQHLAR